MHVSGFSWIYPALMSLTIFTGSVEFIVVNLLLGSFNPLQAFVLAFMVNARHLFYCLRNVDLVISPHGLPEIFGIAATIAIHFFKRQMLLSIAGGTIFH